MTIEQITHFQGNVLIQAGFTETEKRERFTRSLAVNEPGISNTCIIGEMFPLASGMWMGEVYENGEKVFHLVECFGEVFSSLTAKMSKIHTLCFPPDYFE